MRRTKGLAKNNYEIVRTEMRKLFDENYGCYGYRRMTALLRARGYRLNHKLVLRLMRLEKLKCTQREKRHMNTSSFDTFDKNFGKKCDDLLKRDFSTNSFGEKWVTDITEIAIDDKKLYLLLI